MLRLRGRIFLVAIVATVVLAEAPLAQNNPVRRVHYQGPAAPDLGLLGGIDWNRSILGARTRGMGGAFLAVPGELAAPSMNPAGLAFMFRPQFTSGSRIHNGSATNIAAPEQIPGPDNTMQRVSNVRPSLPSNYSYSNMTLALPLLLLNRPAGLALSYRRIVDLRQGWENRSTVSSSLGDAELGVGTEFTGGIDAITPSVAWRINDRVSVGGSLNFLSGDITENGNEGATVFGQVFGHSGLLFQEKTFGTSVDLGSQVMVTDRFRLGAMILPGYTLSFDNGFYSIQLLPVSTSALDSVTIVERPLLDFDMSVPTQYGVGASYRLTDRISLAADYWNESWSKSRMTRQDFTTQTSFPDTNNIFSTLVRLTPTGQTVERDLKLQDTHHVRLGMEWMVKQTHHEGGLRIPLRVGIPREPLTFSDYSADSLQALYGYLGLVSVNPRLSNQQKRDLAAQAMDYLTQQGANFLNSRDKVTGTTISLGTGIQVGAFSADIALTRTSYTATSLFTGAFSDFTLSPNIFTSREKRHINEMNFTTTLRF